MDPRSNLAVLHNLGALNCHDVRTRKRGEPNRDDLIPNLREHGRKGTGDAFVSFDVYIRFVLSLDVLRVKGSVDDGTRDTVCKLRNLTFDQSVDVERDSSDCNCLVTAWKLLY